MNFNPSPSLGILDLERGSSPPPPLPGSMRRADTYGFDVIVETVEGAWVDNVVRGDPALEPAFVAAAQKLVARGAVAISSTCGFSIRHQAAIAASVEVPVVTSSLLFLPMLLRQYPPTSKIAVLTYESTQCDDGLLGISAADERDRIVVGGIEGGKFWRDEMKRPPPPLDLAALEADLTSAIARLRDENPEIAAILLECTAFPFVTARLRRGEALPVYDITDLCRITVASVSSTVARCPH